MEIWAVAGGKGGTGKSFISTALGVVLAEKKKSVLLIDTDFGGANLHSYCGIRKPSTSLKGFFEDKVELEDLVIDTYVPDLSLIPGDFNSSDSDNIKYFQKKKFFRHIRKLNYDYVILDLGAGTRHHTVDTFLIADTKIVITTPDKMAIENLYFFIKSAFFRKVNATLAQCDCKEEGMSIWKNRKKNGVSSLKDFMGKLRDVSPEVREAIDGILLDFRLRIVLNQVRDFNEAEAGLAIKSMVLKYMGIFSTFPGYIRHDHDLWTKLVTPGEYLNRETASRLMPEVYAIAEKLIEG